ncbi:MAG: hypothetical protein RLZZ108_447 [Actinomycetota bacterium]
MSLRSSAFDNDLFALTLLTHDLEASRHFYGSLLGLSEVFTDDVCVIYKCGTTMINLLKLGNANDLAAPAQVGAPSEVSAVYTLKFADIDALANDLVQAGLALLNGPQDQPWGVRTLCVQDPSGHVWEFANH